VEPFKKKYFKIIPILEKNNLKKLPQIMSLKSTY
jgi:hypothetical protein